MLPRLESYEAVCREFSWRIPEFYNIGVDLCDKWAADPSRLALIHERRDGSASCPMRLGASSNGRARRTAASHRTWSFPDGSATARRRPPSLVDREARARVLRLLQLVDRDMLHVISDVVSTLGAALDRESESLAAPQV